MKKAMMEILACPVCKHSPLELIVAQENEREVVSGTLVCKNCGIRYPIENEIPNLLPPQSGCEG